MSENFDDNKKESVTNKHNESYWETLNFWIKNVTSYISSNDVYPKEHVEPHVLSKKCTNICDYSGKVELDIFVTYLPHDFNYGIVHSLQMSQRARQDCYEFCKKNGVFPISMEFIIKNDLNKSFFAMSGGQKNFSILANSETINKNGIITILVSNSFENFISVGLKSFCDLNKLNYKDIVNMLDKELQIFYNINST